MDLMYVDVPTPVPTGRVALTLTTYFTVTKRENNRYKAVLTYEPYQPDGSQRTQTYLYADYDQWGDFVLLSNFSRAERLEHSSWGEDVAKWAPTNLPDHAVCAVKRGPLEAQGYTLLAYLEDYGAWNPGA